MGRILIIAIGSRGDIQPFVALAQGLQSAGHTVALQTAESYRPFIEAHGIPYLFMNNDFIELSQSKQGKAATEGGGMALLKQVMPMLRAMLEDEWRAAQSFAPDLIVYHPKALGALHIGEKLGIPVIQSLALPLSTPTRAFPTPIMPTLPLGAAYNRLTYRLMSLASAPYAGVVNAFRTQTLGLAPRGRFADDQVRSDGTPIPMLYSFSPHVVPRPADYPPHVTVTGYWFLDADSAWTPPEALTRFLDAGAPPVYIGFGSMSGTDPAARTALVLQAVASAGVRAVLARGWGGLETAPLPDTVTMLDEAPHAWLFPRMAAVVHHGGAGTTAAGLRAGKPTVIVPFMVDQPYWGRVVHDLGVGPEPLPQRTLTAEALAGALRQAVSDTTMRRRAETLSGQIASEDGVSRAVTAIERALA